MIRCSLLTISYDPDRSNRSPARDRSARRLRSSNGNCGRDRGAASADEWPVWLPPGRVAVPVGRAASGLGIRGVSASDADAGANSSGAVRRVAGWAAAVLGDCTVGGDCPHRLDGSRTGWQSSGAGDERSLGGSVAAAAIRGDGVSVLVVRLPVVGLDCVPGGAAAEVG